MAKQLAAELAASGSVELLDLRSPEATATEPAGYDLVILGAPTYAGNWPGPVLAWAKRLEAAAGVGLVAIFEIGLGINEVAVRRLLPDLCQRSILVQKFGGQLRWQRLNVFEKFIMKLITKQAGDNSNLDTLAVSDFSARLRTALDGKGA